MPEQINYARRGGFQYDPEYKFCGKCGKPLEKWSISHQSPWNRKTGEAGPTLVIYVIGCPEYKNYEELLNKDDHDHWSSNPTQLVN